MYVKHVKVSVDASGFVMDEELKERRFLRWCPWIKIR